VRPSSRRAPLLLAVAALALAPAAAGAQELDQSQEYWDNHFRISSSVTAWQVFESALTGSLTSVDLYLAYGCSTPAPHMCGPGHPSDLTVEIVETSSGVPTDVVLASATVPWSSASQWLAWISVPFASPIPVTSGTVLGIRLSSTGAGDPLSFQWGWPWGSGDPYPGTGLYHDSDPGDGLDDPTPVDPPADATFRTYVSAEFCGNGVEEAPEECDDANAVGGDGCSAECQDELCGDGVVTGAEACDDGGTIAGDGCSPTCAFEPAAAACRSVIAKSGSRYAAVRLKALLKCKSLLAAGKTLSVDDPAECASETGAAKSIAKAALQARSGIADGRNPKCTDTLVGALDACAETVDGLIDAVATSGCLLATHDTAVDELLEAYGY
jgi:cysteine-rich repeat protein